MIDAGSATDVPLADGANASGDGGTLPPPADPLIDRAIAFEGLQGHAIVTRLRTVLTQADLGVDLALEPSGIVPFGPTVLATIPIDAPPCPGGMSRSRPTPPPSRSSCGVDTPRRPVALVMLAMVGVVFVVRRSRRASRTRRG